MDRIIKKLTVFFLGTLFFTIYLTNNSFSYTSGDGRKITFDSASTQDKAFFDFLNDIKSSSTGYFLLPKGTTGERPGSPEAGMVRYNSDDSIVEVYKTEWRDISGEIPNSTCIVQDKKASGTNGGDSQVTPTVRDLNDTVGACGFLTLASNTITISESGTYKIKWCAPAYKSDRHISALWNASDSTYEGFGDNAFNGAGDTVMTRSCGVAILSLTTSKDFQIRHEVVNALSDFGNGIAAAASLSISSDEIYTRVVIEKKSN